MEWFSWGQDRNKKEVVYGDGVLYYERRPWPVSVIYISRIFLYRVYIWHRLTVLTSDFDYKVASASWSASWTDKITFHANMESPSLNISHEVHAKLHQDGQWAWDRTRKDSREVYRTCRICTFQFLGSRFMKRHLQIIVRTEYLFTPSLTCGGFIKGILRGVRCTKSLRVLFLHRRPPSWTTLILYSRAVFIFNEPAYEQIHIHTNQSPSHPKSISWLLRCHSNNIGIGKLQRRL